MDLAVASQLRRGCDGAGPKGGTRVIWAMEVYRGYVEREELWFGEKKEEEQGA